MSKMGIVFALLIVGHLTLILFQKRRVRRAGKKIAGDMSAIYGDFHEYAEAHAPEFTWLDLQFYDRMAGDFASLGYTWLEDLEDRTMTKQWPTIRTFARTWIAPDGSVAASAYDIKPTTVFCLMGFMRVIGVLPKVAGAIDLETALTDGTFVNTTIGGENAALLDFPPELRQQSVARNLPLDTAIRHHLGRVAGYLAQSPGVAVYPVFTRETHRQMQHAVHAIKARFRQARGGISRQELSRIGGTDFQEEAHAVADVVEKLPRPRRQGD